VERIHTGLATARRNLWDEIEILANRYKWAREDILSLPFLERKHYLLRAEQRVQVERGEELSPE
jgi:hypothetical protein